MRVISKKILRIKGNRYRLVAKIHHNAGIVYIRFIGHMPSTIGSMRKASEEAKMEVRPITSEADYEVALAEIEALLDAEPNIPECDTLEVLATLVEVYESEHYDLPDPDPIDALEYYLESRHMTRKDLEPFIGTRARVSEIFNRKRPLTLPMIRRLAAGTGISASILIQPYETEQRSLEIEPVAA